MKSVNCGSQILIREMCNSSWVPHQNISAAAQSQAATSASFYISFDTETNNNHNKKLAVKTMEYIVLFVFRAYNTLFYFSGMHRAQPWISSVHSSIPTKVAQLQSSWVLFFVVVVVRAAVHTFVRSSNALWCVWCAKRSQFANNLTSKRYKTPFIPCTRAARLLFFLLSLAQTSYYYFILL